MMHVHHFVFNDFLENSYVVWDETGECVIIDPGSYYPSEKEDLIKFIKGKNLTPKLLLNTHCHVDHVFGNKWVRENYHIDFRMHEKDLPVLMSAIEVGKFYGLAVEPSPQPDRFIVEGESVKFGNAEFKTLFTPGHSPGSVSFYSEPDRLLISGDVLFQMSIGRTDLPGGDYETLMQSIVRQLLPLPDDVIVYSGHGPSTTIGFERMNNPFILEYAASGE